jgi:DNA-binding transcriptional LysR family regulator
VCEEGSFSKAGRRFFLSEPSVSARIKHLEEVLGFDLFSRSRRGVQLTDAGTVFRSRVAPSLEGLQAAVVEGQAASRRRVSRITLWASASTLSHLLPSMLDGFQAQHPEAEIAVRSAQPGQVLAQLSDGSIDCAIVHEPERPHLPGFRELELFRNVVGLVVAPGHPLAHQSRVTLPELAAHRLLHYEQGRGYWPVIQEALRRGGHTPAETLSIESLDGLRELAKRGFGMVILALSMVLEEVERGELLFLPLQTGPGQLVENHAWFCCSRTHRFKHELADLAAITQVEATALQRRLDRSIRATDGFVEFNPTVHLAQDSSQ